MRDYSTWVDQGPLQEGPGQGGGSRERGGPAGRETADSPLSKLHISPQEWPGVTWWEGSSLLKVSKGGHCTAPEGGLRAEIHGFSADSRRRLLYLVGKVRRDAPLPVFVTLTYPDAFPNARDSKRHLDQFLKRLRRAFDQVGLIWKLEPQERGAPHYHMLVWGVPLDELRGVVPFDWFDIAGGGDAKHLRWHLGLCGNGNEHCCQQVRSRRGVLRYASKYLGKTFEQPGWEWPGRFWGKVNASHIPLGEERYQEVSHSKAIELHRYQRRFSGMKSRGRSMVTFCDASQWVGRLVNDAAATGAMGIAGTCHDSERDYSNGRTSNGGLLHQNSPGALRAVGPGPAASVAGADD